MGRLNKCCVNGCGDVASKRHRFPKRNPSLFKTWVDIIKPIDWQILSVDQIYNRYYVCNAHFEDRYILEGSLRGLTVHAVPTLGVQGVSAVFDDSMNQPSTSTVQSLMESTNEGSVSADFDDSMNQPSTSTVQSLMESTNEGIDNCCNDNGMQEAVAVLKKVPGKKVHSAKGFPILRKLNCTRKIQLTPREKVLYDMLRKCRNRLNEKKHEMKCFQERLDGAQKIMHAQGFMNILNQVNEATFHFINCQITNQKVHPKARRFTLDEKVLALALYKASPKAYRLLCKLFCLPSSRTLSRLLEKLIFKPGVNDHIFDQLRQTVCRMTSRKDKVCALIFDEISLATNLSYDRVADIVVGLQDDGLERKARLVDHANVFFLKGLYRQYKQPLAFTFSQGPISSLQLKQMIKLLIEKCQSIGLDITATICDQGTNNQAAIKSLIEEKKEFCLRNGIEDRFFGFLVNNKEIVPLFDTPHLFKGLRNNLLTKDAHFILNGQKKIAKWEHVQRFYDLNVSEPNLKINHKLSDAHVVPGKINKMKVKLCTQVFSHSVGSMMKLISQWEIKHPLQLPREAIDTADFILFLDELFDSLNVSRASTSTAKPLKRAIVNGSQLPSYIDRKVSVTGFVDTAVTNALTFELRATDNVMVKVNLKRPLSRPIEGYVEVQGVFQNRAITASNLIVFENSDFDAEGHNTLCSLLQSIPNLWSTQKV